jgi:hypothetical protein
MVDARREKNVEVTVVRVIDQHIPGCRDGPR